MPDVVIDPKRRVQVVSDVFILGSAWCATSPLKITALNLLLHPPSSGAAETIGKGAM
jgi:hypothetical protein